MISTKGRYALRVMADLAQQHTDRYIPLDEIAVRQGISKKIFGKYTQISRSGKTSKRSQGKRRRLQTYKRSKRIHGRRDYLRSPKVHWQ